jgi:hypothetical protein
MLLGKIKMMARNEWRGGMRSRSHSTASTPIQAGGGPWHEANPFHEPCRGKICYSVCSRLPGHKGTSGENLPTTREGPRRIQGGWIAQGSLSTDHLLNVIGVENENEIIVVTFYPGRRERDEGAI